MNFEAIQKVDFTSKFSDFEVINSEFTKCRCYALASGDNANGSDITDNAIDKAIARNEFYNKPIVAHLYKDPNNNAYRVGGHDSKVVISDEGIEFINECVPFGTIPESANIHKEKVLEPDGVTYNTYLVMDVILWTGRYNIMDAAYNSDIYFNESCEISINDYHYKDNGILAIDDFTFSALCLLNRSDNKEDNVLPCFPSCRVEKIQSFSLDETQFKKNFELMLEKLKSYESGDKSVQDNNNNFEKEEKTVMDKAKIMEALAAFTYENAVGETVGKYALIDVAENSIGLIDRQDNKAYSINFVETKGEIVFDFDNAVECSFTTKEKVEDDFDYAGEIIVANETSAKVKENEFSTRIADAMKKEMDKFNAQIDELSNAYEDLKKQYDVASEKLAQYEAADEKRKAEQHEAEVEAIYEKFAKKINRVPEFLCYRADRKNIEKDTETIEAELTVIAGKAAMNKAQTFSYVPTTSGVKEIKESNELAYTDRYGDLFAKFIK